MAGCMCRHATYTCAEGTLMIGSGSAICHQELQAKHQEGLPRLDPVEDLGLNDPVLKGIVQNIQRLEAQLAACKQPSEKQCVPA